VQAVVQAGKLLENFVPWGVRMGFYLLDLKFRNWSIFKSTNAVLGLGRFWGEPIGGNITPESVVDDVVDVLVLGVHRGLGGCGLLIPLLLFLIDSGLFIQLVKIRHLFTLPNKIIFPRNQNPLKISNEIYSPNQILIFGNFNKYSPKKLTYTNFQ
jgi:uncharacterized membrane protein